MSEPLKNAQHEVFAQAVASGLSASEAYRKTTRKNANANVHSSRWMTKDNICARITELQKASATRTTLSMQERREFFSRVVRSRLHKLDLEQDGDLVQEIIDTEDGRRIKLPGKRECIMDDAKLAGDLTEKHEVNAGTGLLDLIDALRAGKS